MGKQDFDLVMSEIDRIIEAVKKFPESAQGSACTALVSALIHRSTESPNGSTSGHGYQSQGTMLPSKIEAEEEDRDYIAAIKSDVADYGLNDVSDIEFAAYATRFYTEAGPEDVRVDTFNNAKKAKEPLLKSGRKQGTFTLTAMGRFHVENVLLRSDES